MGVDPPSTQLAQYSLVAVMAMLSEARKWKIEPRPTRVFERLRNAKNPINTLGLMAEDPK